MDGLDVTLKRSNLQRRTIERRPTMRRVTVKIPITGGLLSQIGTQWVARIKMSRPLFVSNLPT